MTKSIRKTYEPQSTGIARVLIRKIRNGEYAPGQRLDSIRSLASHYGVSRQVICSAFDLMSRQNYIYTIHGNGTYVNAKLQIGLYHRLGWFHNQLNPGENGLQLHEAYKYAASRNFVLIPGHNFEEQFTFAEWLEHKSDLDGVIVTGLVDEDLLKFPKQHKVPYLVFGNYDISEEHPQIRYNVQQGYYEALLPLLREHRWQSFAVIGGSPDLRADREAMEGIQNAIRDAGMDLSQGIFKLAWDDGFNEVAEALKRKPEVLIFIGLHWLGLRKYCERYPDHKRPTVVINSTVRPEVPKHLYDHAFTLKDNFGKSANVRQAIDLLIHSIETKEGTPIC